MKLDIINREHQGLIFPAWRLVFPMTPKRIILPAGVYRSQREEGTKMPVEGDVCALLILVINVPSWGCYPQDVSIGLIYNSQSGPHRGKKGGTKKKRTELPLCLRSNRARTHRRSETGQSFWFAISTAKEPSTGRGTQRKLHNKLTIQNGTWTWGGRECMDRAPTL